MPQLELVDPVGSAELVDEAEETLTHINSSYTLSDYLLPRGYANLYVSGWGQKDSQGLMTNGSTNKSKPTRTLSTGSMAVAGPTDHTRKRQVKADWSNGRSQPPGSLPWNHVLTALRPQVWTVLKSSLQGLGSLLGTTTTAKTAS